MAMEDFAGLRKTIFDDLKLSLDYFLNGLGAAQKVGLPSMKEHWMQQVRSEPILADLLDKYLELEIARFMKVYGATRVHPQLLEHFLSLIASIHNYRLPPLLSVLKEYEATSKDEVKAYQEF